MKLFFKVFSFFLLSLLLSLETYSISNYQIDKICKRKYGHVNWARFDKITPKELLGNPHEFDYENGVVYFKNAYLV